MNGRPRHKIKCRIHERQWNGRCVDRNLKDEWLLKLNKFKNLDLVSICEGLSERRGVLIYGHPHLNLKIKPEIFDLVAKAFYKKNLVISALQKTFIAIDTNVEFEFRSVFRRMFRNFSFIKSIVIRLTYLRQRNSEHIDEETINWFEAVILQIESFDEFISNLINGKDT